MITKVTLHYTVTGGGHLFTMTPEDWYLQIIWKATYHWTGPPLSFEELDLLENIKNSMEAGVIPQVLAPGSYSSRKLGGALRRYLPVTVVLGPGQIGVFALFF